MLGQLYPVEWRPLGHQPYSSRGRQSATVLMRFHWIETFFVRTGCFKPPPGENTKPVPGKSKLRVVGYWYVYSNIPVAGFIAIENL